MRIYINIAIPFRVFILYNTARLRNQMGVQLLIQQPKTD